MAYLAGLIIVAIFFIVLQYFTELTKIQKFIVSAVILSIILSAIAYNKNNTSNRENMLNVVTKYKQNKSVKCNGTEVNNTNYTLSIGTYTFIGKENTENYGKMISVSNCE
ncbi:MAG: hypothetical protein COB17_03450 [Sulfurimonas sp.]|nr:MAG: hypothetical protein COB17_03450 [Sulfurimonas sp.]